MSHTFQETIRLLESFWKSKGCTVTNSYDIEMGAATFHPHTVLSVIRNKPVQMAFMQPCRRPQDGRGGNNPNRLYKHHQFQVIMVPPPQDIQSLVIKSLYLCGVDPSKHSIDFVENNWQSPSMGAAGKGYEILCNGTEVLQFTYFQQLAGKELRLIPVELAYGVERLSLVVQNKRHVYNLLWDVVNGKEVTYGQVNGTFEAELARPNYPPSLLNSLFNTYETMCLQVADNEVLIPSYELFLKLSHIFNLIEATGTLSVTERVNLLARARKCANACLARFIGADYE